MARIVKADNYRMPKKSRKLLSDTKGMSNRKSLNYLAKNKAPKLTTLKDIGAIAYPLVKKYKPYGLKITKSSSMEGHNKADAIFINNKGAEIVIHPVLQYYPKSYVKQTILHEVDHLKADIRNKKIKPTK